MKVAAFKEILLSILKSTVNEIEKAKKQLEDDPFNEPQYETQESYDKFLETIGIDDLLNQIKNIISKLEK